MGKFKVKLKMFFLILTFCSINGFTEELFPESKFKFDDTTVIPFIDSTYFSNQYNECKCLKLIDFKNYSPLNAKKYIELFRIIREIESRPVSFEIGLIDNSVDVIIKIPNEPLAAIQCRNDSAVELSVIKFKNLNLSEEKDISEIINNIKNLKKRRANISSTNIIKIEYYDMSSDYYFSYKLFAGDNIKIYKTIINSLYNFTYKQKKDIPIWIIEGLKRSAQK